MQITTNILSGKTQTHLNDSCLLHTDVFGPFSVLQSAAENEGFDLQVASGFRSYERQLLIWNEKATGKRPLLDNFGQQFGFGAGKQFIVFSDRHRHFQPPFLSKYYDINPSTHNYIVQYLTAYA